MPALSSRLASYSVCILVSLSSALAANEPLPRQLLPEKAAITIEVGRLDSLYEHPVVQRFWTEFSQIADLQQRMVRPEFDRYLQLKRLVESASGTDWIAAIGKLTAGGAALSVVGQPGSPPDVTLAVCTEDEACAGKFAAALQSAILDRLPMEQRPAALPTELHRNIPCVKVGEARYAQVRNWLLAGSQSRSLTAAIDRLLDAGPVAAEKTAPLVRAEVDLALLKMNPEFQKALQLPTDDPGRILAFAGWIDLLTRAGRVKASLAGSGPALELQLELDAGRLAARPELAGFFASKPGERALPPLIVPETIASFSWTRDYAALWNGRAGVLSDKAREKIEEDDAQSRRQLEVVGGRFTLSELVSHLGTHFRLVAARQKQTAYRSVELQEKLPAIALCVDLRDDQFQELIKPLLRLSGIIAAADGRRMATNVEMHRQSTLTSFRWREDAETLAKGDRLRYQFSPTYAFAENHFVIGTTTEIVRETIDALADEAARKTAGSLPEGTTESSVISWKEAAASVLEYRNTLVTNRVLQEGILPADAESDLAAFSRAVGALGHSRFSLKYDDDRFHVRLTVGDEAKAVDSPRPASK